MNAEHLLALADAVRAYALEGGRDLNAANLFVHEVLTRALRAEAAGTHHPVSNDEFEAA